MSACRGCRLTVGALLPASPPVAAALRPAAHAATLHGTLGAGLGEAAEVRVVVSVVVHRRIVDRGAEPPHGGVSGQQRGGGARGAHAHHGAAQDVTDAVWGARLQLAVEARVELVEGIRHRVLAHRGLQVRGKLVQAVGEQERPLDVRIHVAARDSASGSQYSIQAGEDLGMALTPTVLRMVGLRSARRRCKKSPVMQKLLLRKEVCTLKSSRTLRGP